MTYEETSHHFEISIRTLFRWEQKIEPCVARDKPATKVDMARLQEDVEKYPDDYQWERTERLNVIQPAIHYELKRLNISFKKTLIHPQVDEQCHLQFQKRIEKHPHDGKSIIYLDESGFVQSMPRIHGYSEKGKRCYGKHD